MPTTEDIAKYIPALIAGTATQSSIARDLGVSRQNIKQRLDKGNIQELIKTAQAELVNEALQKAVKNQVAKIDLSSKIIRQVIDGQETHPLAKTMAELGDRAEVNLLAATGIGPSHATSVQINNILVDNRVQLSPVIQGLLADRLGSVIQEPIDADFED